MQRLDKAGMTNTPPNRQEATGLNINPMDPCPPITFLYF